MSKVRVVVDLDDLEDHNYGEIRDLVKWALDSDVHTEAMRVERVTVEPRGEEAHVRRQR
jgi:hypothetical protein